MTSSPNHNLYRTVSWASRPRLLLSFRCGNNSDNAQARYPRKCTTTLVRSAVAVTLVISAILLSCGALLADWPAYRGGMQRTGNVDEKPGPTKPNILWVWKSQEHFLTSPSLDGGTMYVSGMGAFGSAGFYAVDVSADAAKRILWSKGTPFIKLATVCSPAVADGLIVFGDGMHQTDGAALYCLAAKTGRPMWQYPLPGKLVHLESAPTIAKDRVYIGGGDAGVVCVELKKVKLDGKDQDLSAVAPAIDKAWQDLQAKYEQDRKTQGDLAVPPTEDQLPQPSPKLVWQAGANKWHVDAPVCVAGDKVIAASAYIDDEKVGKRSLVAINAADGSVTWETPLEVNPWAGAAVAGDTVIVGCSSIRFDRKLINGAKGQIVAVELATGKIKWTKPVAGGVLSAPAVKGDLVVFTATDGKIRAIKLADGADAWTYDAGAPFFAAPAVAGELAYAADLKSVLHAVKLADGKGAWKLDIASDPAVQLPGTMVYGSPIVAGGNLYLATCNIDGDQAQLASAVVCVSDTAAGGPKTTASAIVVDKARRTITIPCKVAPRKLPNLSEVYPLEVVATLPSPQGQKAHETVVTFTIKPSDVAAAMDALGVKPGSPAREGSPASGPEVKVSLELPGFDSKPLSVPIEKAIIDKRTGKPLPPLKWYYTGSAMRQPDPDKPAKVYAADLGGTLIALFPVTDETVFETNMTMTHSRLLKLEVNKNLLPDEGAAVKLVIEVPK